MKTFLSAIFILLLVGVSQAQDTSLTTEICQIYLHSGKKIDKVTLWKIDSVRVEYVKGGNLSDILTSDILRIESLNYRMEFDEKFKMIQKTYDLIELDYGDTTRGIIKKFNNQSSVTYIAAGKNNYPLKTSTFRSYVLRNTAEDISNNHEDKDTTEITSKDELVQSDLEAQVNKEEKDRKSKKLNSQLIAAIIVLTLFRYVSIISY